jgi:hypothetical protein
MLTVTKILGLCKISPRVFFLLIIFNTSREGSEGKMKEIKGAYKHGKLLGEMVV